jgi:hypothetical protein
VRVLTGSRMVLRLVLGIGPVHARRALRAIRSALHEPAAAPVELAAAGRQVSRRQVLEWSGGALGALMLGPRALRQLSHPVTRPSAGVAASHITVGDAEQLKQLAGVQAASARFGTLNWSAAQAVRQGGRTSTSIPFLPVQGSPASALVISDYGTGRGYDYFVVSVTGPKDSLAFTVMTVQGAELARLTKSHGTLHGYSAGSADSAMAASRTSLAHRRDPCPRSAGVVSSTTWPVMSPNTAWSCASSARTRGGAPSALAVPASGSGSAPGDAYSERPSRSDDNVPAVVGWGVSTIPAAT